MFTTFAFGSSTGIWLAIPLALCLGYPFSYASAANLEPCPERFCLISCPSKDNCLAMDYLKSPLRGNLSSNGGINPGAGVCKKRDGFISMVRDIDGNETSVCNFRDGSQITVEGLWIW